MYARLFLPLATCLALTPSAAEALTTAPGLAFPQAYESGPDDDEGWAESDPLGDALNALQGKRFAEAARLLGSMGDDPSAQYLLGSMYRFGSLGEADPVAARKALETSARGFCADAAIALADLIEDSHFDTTEEADDRVRTESETWRLRAVAMGHASASIDAALGLAPTSDTRATLTPKQNAQAARAIAWIRIAKKSGVDGASELETALLNRFAGAVEASVPIQRELEARIESERAKVGSVSRMQVPEEFFFAKSPFDAAYERYDNEEYAEALAAFLPMAEAGNTEAAFYVARIHEMGYVGRPNGPVAERWYLRAAEAGIHAATANLGYMYLDGRGVPKNMGKATDYFLAAAYGGNLEGAINVGFAYGTGQGRAKDLVEAHAWYSIAAGDGIEAAGNNRGIIERDMSPSDISAAKARLGELEAELRGERQPKLALPALGGQAERTRSAAAVEIHDDLMGGMQSHELQLPDGWNFDGGLSWNPQDAMAHANIEGLAWLPSGEEVRFLPSGSFTYFSEMEMPGSPPRPQEGDFAGGAIFLDPGKGPEEFVTRVILGSYRPNVQELRVVSSGEALPVSRFYQGVMEPMVQQMSANGQQPGVDTSHEVKCPVIRVRYVDGGRAFEEEFTFLYARFDMAMEMSPQQKMTSTLWYVFDARALRAPEGTLDASRAKLREVAQSLRPTQEWAAMLDHVRATFYGDQESFQALQGLDHAGSMAKLKQHVTPLLAKSADITAQGAAAWSELTTRFDGLDRAWAEALGGSPDQDAGDSQASPFGDPSAPAPKGRRGGFRIR